MPRNVGTKNLMRRNSVKITVSVKCGFLIDVLYQILGATFWKKTYLRSWMTFLNKGYPYLVDLQIAW